MSAVLDGTRTTVVLAFFLLTATLAAQGPPARSKQPGSITGILFTHDGTPAASMRVSALEVGNPLFPDSQSLASIAQTDKGGRFRLEDVPPGRYLITAGTLDLPTYFPGVDNAPAAGIVTVTPAANLAGMNFNLSLASGLHFSGKVIRQDNSGRTITGTATAATAAQPLQVRLQGPNLPMQMAVVAADSTFDFPQVRPGTYQINIQPSPARLPQMTVTLVDQDISGYELVLPLMVQVTGTVTVEEGGPSPRFPIVFSNANDPSPLLAGAVSGVQQNIQTQAAPRFNVQVPVGTNRVTPDIIPGGFTIKKFTAGGVDLTANPLVVTPAGAPQIQIVLSATSVTWVRLSGRVNGHNILNGNTISINSTQASSAPPQIVLYLDGSFEIPKALPGSYRVGAGGPAGAADLVVPGGLAEVTGVVIDAGLPDGGSAAAPAGGPSSAVRVIGRIIGRAKAQPGAQVRIENSETGMVRSAPIYVDGSFEFQRVQPGSYSAEVTPTIPGSRPTVFTVGVRDLGDVQVQVPAFRDIAGKVALEGAGELPRTLVFMVASTPVPADVRSDGSFTVALPDGLPVALAPDALPASFAVSALTYGILNLLENPLSLSGPESELRVALKTARGTAAVSGRISGDTAALGEVRIWLTDTNGRQRTLETIPAPSGAFVFPDVAEGAYAVSFAVPGIPASAVSVPVNVTAGRNITDVNLVAPRVLQGRVKVDGGIPPPRFALRVEGGPAGAATLVIDPKIDGAFSVFLPTGEGTVGPATGLPAGLAIRAITLGSTDLRQNPLRIPASGALEELTIQLGPASR